MNDKKYIHEAFWISPGGRMLPVTVTHIKRIMENPVEFGLSREFILAEYTRHGEDPGSEGDARREIIIELIRKGFMRIRYYPGKARWTVNVWNMTGTVVAYLRAWAGEMIVQGVCMSDEVLIDMPGRQVISRLNKIRIQDLTDYEIQV